MMHGKEVYEVVSGVVPLYTAMLLAYASVRWWKIFTQEQCDGINRFVAVFAFPLLALRSISAINLYHLNLPFVASDFIHKVVVLVALCLWHAFSRRSRRLDWVITIFSISTLPNNLVIGVALLRAMHGDPSANLMVQVFVLQFAFWYTVLDFLYEYRAARALVSERFPGVAASIASFKVDADVVSLSGGEHPLDTDVEVDDNGRVYAIVRRSGSNLSKSGVCPSSTLSKLPSGQQSVIHGAGDLSYVEMDWGRSFSCDFSINRGGRVADCHYPIHSPMSMRSVSLRFMERDGGGGRRSNLRLADINRAATTSIGFTTMIIDHDTTTPIGNEMILV